MSRQQWLNVARGLFLVAAVAFGWWWLGGDWAAVVEAMSTVGMAHAVGSVLVVGLGLAGTGILWSRFLRAFGYKIGHIPAFSVFFVGQLGKYIPGSVWTFGAQAQMARSRGVPARTTVVVGLIFLGWNVATAGAVGAAASLARWIDAPVPGWLAAVVGTVAILSLTPPVTRLLARRLAGGGTSFTLSWRDYGALLLLMSGVWAAFGLGLWLLALGGGGASSGLTITTCIGAYCVAYAVGVLVILAPAGLGAREATLILLLEPIVGLPAATAMALLSRLVHTFTDFALAAAGYVALRRLAADQPVREIEAS